MFSLRAEAARAAIVEFAEIVARKSSVAVVWTKLFIAHTLGHSCVFSFLFSPSTELVDEL